MRRILPLVAAVTLGTAAHAGAQAPASASLWRIAAGSLPNSAALQRGATGSFWNPGADGSGPGVTAGIDVIHTSNVVGVSGILAAANASFGSALRLGAVLGRMQVRDLVRTTTSPDGQDGSIPVYEQLAGIGVGIGTAMFQLGGMLRVHHARFDALRETGVTLDVGVVLTPLDRLTLAAATHFLPIDLSNSPATDYYGAAQYRIAQRTEVAGLSTQLTVRYGVSYRASGDLDHTAGIGATFDDRISIDAALTSESGYGDREWRPGLGIAVQFGRYTVTVARGLGLNDVGGTFRVGLEFGFRP